MPLKSRWVKARRENAAWLVVAGAALFAALASRAQADAFPTLSPFRAWAPSALAVDLSPFRTLPQPRALARFRAGTLDLDAAMRQVLAAGLGSPYVAVTSTNEGGGTLVFRFSVDGVPLCDHEVRAHALPDRAVLALGSLPRLDGGAVTSLADWPPLAQARAAAALYLASELGGEPGDDPTRTPARCYVVADGSLVPVWRLDLAVDGAPYKVLADAGMVHAADRAFFEADGVARVYPFNSVATPELADLPLTGLTDDGTLTSTDFRTILPAGLTPANEPTHSYVYDPADLRFGEASAFAHATAHMAFLSGLGFQWYGPRPMKIYLHVPNFTNNARFLPGGTTSPSYILIGDGYGKQLKGLEKDADVIAHELGHFAIYKTITKTSGEAMVIHEGLADYFEFARSGDGCLGESICPEGGHACVLEAQCLRTSLNDWRYGDATWVGWGGDAKLTHLHGQVLSGMLWDLRKPERIPAATLDRLVMRAVDFLPAAAKFSDLLAALLTAEKELSGGQFETMITEGATARGLAAFLPNGAVVPPPAPVPADQATNPAEPVPAPEPEESGGDAKEDRKKKIGPVTCGLAASGPEGGSSTGRLLLLALLLAPVGLALRRR